MGLNIFSLGNISPRMTDRKLKLQQGLQCMIEQFITLIPLSHRSHCTKRTRNKIQTVNNSMHRSKQNFYSLTLECIKHIGSYHVHRRYILLLFMTWSSLNFILFKICSFKVTHRQIPTILKSHLSSHTSMHILEFIIFTMDSH